MVYKVDKKEFDTDVKNLLNKVELLNSLEDKFGNGVAEIVTGISIKNAVKQWKQIKKSQQNRSIENFIKLLWEPAGEHGCDFEVIKEENGTRVLCKKCYFHEMAKAVHDYKWLYNMQCIVDPDITTEFNENIVLDRKKILMNGDDCCDFFYSYKNQKKK